MKRTIIGAAFFIGGAILLSAEANSGGGGFVFGFFGIGFGVAGMAILIYELTIKEKD